MPNKRCRKRRSVVTFAALLLVLPFLTVESVKADSTNDAAEDETFVDGTFGSPDFPPYPMMVSDENLDSGQFLLDSSNPQWIRIGKRVAGPGSWFSVTPFTRKSFLLDKSTARAWHPGGTLGGFALVPSSSVAAANQRLMARRATGATSNTGNWYLGKRSVDDNDDVNNTVPTREDGTIRFKRDTYGGLWALDQLRQRSPAVQKRLTPIIWPGSSNRYMGKRAAKNGPWYLGKRGGNEGSSPDRSEQLDDEPYKRARTGPWYLGRKRAGGGVWYLGK